MLSVSSCVLSSNMTMTPGSSYSTAPRTMNSAASIVLPQPAAPQTRVGRPWGRPPSVISSSPRMPVGVLRNCWGGGAVFVDRFWGISGLAKFSMTLSHPMMDEHGRNSPAK